MTDKTLKEKLYDIIFGTDTPAGKAFDLILISLILISVSTVLLDSIGVIHQSYKQQLIVLEWVFTAIFTVEYMVRLYCSPKPFVYARSFYGLVDLVSFLPTYLAFFITGANHLLVIRLLRVLRIFRILRLMRYLSDANILMRSMMRSRRKIFLFFSLVLVVCTIFGSLMFIVEGPEHGFSSIPKSIYWTIVTVTTVGYGDITPQTALGQGIAALAMLTGYSIIAVPTGILTAELAQEMQRDKSMLRGCSQCDKNGHEVDANHCKYCGEKLPDPYA